MNGRVSSMEYTPCQQKKQIQKSEGARGGGSGFAATGWSPFDLVDEPRGVFTLDMCTDSAPEELSKGGGGLWRGSVERHMDLKTSHGKAYF
jgi:hypothetical protein